jgi:hypothetical protein
LLMTRDTRNEILLNGQSQQIFPDSLSRWSRRDADKISEKIA